MYKYDLSEKAKEDLFQIYEFGIAKFGESQADKYFDMMHECFTKIAMYPFLFSAISNVKANYRKCICGVDAIYYKVNKDAIEINAIIGRQDFDIENLIR
jgi:toxin ParE1/3/4